jgi:hypothetical protein
LDKEEVLLLRKDMIKTIQNNFMLSKSLILRNKIKKN